MAAPYRRSLAEFTQFDRKRSKAAEHRTARGSRLRAAGPVERPRSERYLNTEPGVRVLRAMTINAISNMPA